jgi:hypothetical protein
MMLTTESWIPIEGTHEVGLIQVLTERKRRFIKPLRYDARSAAQFATALLLDAGDLPMPLHVVSGLTDAKDRALKQKAIGERNEACWVWCVDQGMPALPAVAKYKIGLT